MEVDEATAVVLQLRREVVEKEQIAATAQREARVMREIINGYVRLFPQLEDLIGGPPPNDPSEQPKGAEAVRLILQDAPNIYFTVSELVTALKERGWMPESANPANAVRTAVERLVANFDDTDVVKYHHDGGTVSYSYQPDRDHSPDPF